LLLPAPYWKIEKALIGHSSPVDTTVPGFPELFWKMILITALTAVDPQMVPPGPG